MSYQPTDGAGRKQLTDDLAYNDRLRAIENNELNALRKFIKQQHKVVTGQVLRKWLKAYGATDVYNVGDVDPQALEDIKRDLHGRLDKIADRMNGDLEKRVDRSAKRATKAGSQHAQDIIKVHGGSASGKVVEHESPNVGDIKDRVDKRKLSIAGGIDKVTKYSDVEHIVGRMSSMYSLARSYVAHAVTHSADKAMTQVCAAHNIGRVWVAEEDACLECLAYSGDTVPSDGEFAGGKSFNPNSAGFDTTENPPLHMNCRCYTTPWSDDWDTGEAGTSYPEALKREAQRSVLKGWSLASESNKARISATKLLLRQGTNLPKSVRAQAARAVERGAYKSTNVPGKR
jgi:hypothetical protein